MNDFEPLVSVIIPTFGRANYIERAITSVLNQTHTNFEIIIVDDNGLGTNNQILTKQVVEKFLVNNKIRYFSYAKNMNGSYARNYGANYANGDYICFLDDDDEFVKTKIEKQLVAMANGNYGACYCGHIRKNLISGKNTIYNPGAFGDVKKNMAFNDVDFCLGSTLMIKKDIFDSFGGFDVNLKRFQDYNLGIKIAFSTLVGVVSTPETIIYTHDGSNKPKQFFEIEKARNDYYSSVINYINNLDKKSVRRFVFLHNYFLLKEATKAKKIKKIFKYFFACKNPFSIVKQFSRERRSLSQNEKCNTSSI